jgi:hypothetical protein
MISGDFLYYGMNALVGIIALLSLFAIPKMIPDAQGRKRLNGALVLLVLSGIIFSISLRAFRMSSVIYTGAQVGRVPHWAFTVVDSFKNIVLIGNILDLAALIMLISVTKMLIGRVNDASGKENV